MLPGLPPVDIPLPLLAGCRWLDPGTRIVVQETCIIGNSALGRLRGVCGVWGVDTGHDLQCSLGLQLLGWWR